MGRSRWRDAGRHILVDTAGFLLGVVVHPANLPDRKGGQLVLDAVGERFPRVQWIWADQGSTGSRQRWATQRYGLTLDVVYPHWRQLRRSAPDLVTDRGDAPGFHVLPRRWVVERTFSWLGRCRRLSTDDERLATSAESFISLVGIRLLLARLTRGEK